MAAMTEPHVYTWAEVAAHNTGGTRTRFAYMVLNTFHREATGGRSFHCGPPRVVNVEPLDLTDGRRFDWKSYLAGHRDGHVAVGQGVFKFELRCLADVSPAVR